MTGNIDPYTIATNGLLTSDSNTIIVDPLGYYVLYIEEEIVIEQPDTNFGGGAGHFSPPLMGGKGTKKFKKIKLCVKFNDEIADFCEEFYLDNFNSKITDAKLTDNNTKIELKISNPQLIDNEQVKPIVKVINIK